MSDTKKDFINNINKKWQKIIIEYKLLVNQKKENTQQNNKDGNNELIFFSINIIKTQNKAQ